MPLKKTDQRPRVMSLKLKKIWVKELNRHFPKNTHEEQQTQRKMPSSALEKNKLNQRESLSPSGAATVRRQGTRTVTEDPVH